ncbi:hypothetical protein Btru_024432 [Bulinus truncatus]|nr:hypothetical protein Btru_024432 [Bulinus truncatus]
MSPTYETVSGAMSPTYESVSGAMSPTYESVSGGMSPTYESVSGVPLEPPACNHRSNQRERYKGDITLKTTHTTNSGQYSSGLRVPENELGPRRTEARDLPHASQSLFSRITCKCGVEIDQKCPPTPGVFLFLFRG